MTDMDSIIKGRLDYPQQQKEIILLGKPNQSSAKKVNAAGMHDGEYHTYGLEWNEKYLKFYFDGNIVRTITKGTGWFDFAQYS